jgi:CelD/BcsL family acetyltransferase involved in cellulose biosynthesis
MSAQQDPRPVAVHRAAVGPGDAEIVIRALPIDEVRGDAGLLERWRDLERRALEPNPFFAPQMLLPAARHLAPPASLRLVVVERADTMLFLLPVVDATPRELVPIPVGTPLRRLRAAGLRTWVHRYCFLATPLVDPEADPDAVWTEVLDGLGAVRPAPWLELPLLAADGPVGAALRRVCADRPARHISLGERGFVRRRPENTYLRQWVTSKNRANLARRRRHLQRDLGGDVATVQRGHGRRDVEQFLRLESAGWKGRHGTALLCREGDASFVREMASEFSADGRFVLLSLEAGGRTVAQTTAIIAGAGLFGFKRAYDEGLAPSSPGTLLDVDLLDWFHRRHDLEWIDTSAEPRVADRGLYGDRLELGTTVVGLGRGGRRVPAMFGAVDTVRDLRRRARRRIAGRVEALRSRVRRANSGGAP